MGLNILPSTPLSDRMGIKTIRIMSCPNTAEFIILVAPCKVILSLMDCVSAFPKLANSAFFRVIWNAMYSTMITAPSIMIPKSMAPRLNKLASTPKMFIKVSAKSKQRGITEATTSPERQLPSNSTTTKTTIKQPKTKFSVTVNVVLPISSLRSRKGLI